MKLAILTPCLIAATSCAGMTNTPSLAPRAIEKGVVIQTPVTSPAAKAQCNDPDRATRNATAIGIAQAADTRFEQSLRLARSTAPKESDAWIDAQTARSAATIEHAATIDQATLLDHEISMQIDRCDMTPTIAARDAVQRIADRQTDALNALSP